MFDPRSPYHRRMWHYESDRPLSVPQLVAMGSLDAHTASLLWLLIERHHSLIVSGPTDPTPGVGKTTTLNALLGFLPAGSSLVYTAGMYEDFDFKALVPPASTCVLANEVSDHLSIYMWGRVARTLLKLPQEGFAIATSCHADAVSDVLDMLTHDLRLAAADIAQLGIIVNIGLVGRAWPPRRRFLTVNFLSPEQLATSDGGTSGVRLLPLATWDSTSDAFIPATAETMRDLAGITGMAEDEFLTALERRRECVETLARNRGAGIRTTREAVDTLAAEERGEPLAVDGEEAESGS